MKSVKFNKWEVQSILDGSMPVMQFAIDEAKSAYPDGSGRGWIFWANGGDPQETRKIYPDLSGFECPWGWIGDKIEINDTNIKLEIVGVSVERLQAISIGDIKSEGI